jgi:hypothetical protein
MKLGHLCLCFYLIVVGVLSVTNVQFVWSGPITGLLALAAGILLLLDK